MAASPRKSPGRSEKSQCIRLRKPSIKVDGGDKSQEMEQQDASVGVSWNGLGSPDCIHHGTTVYRGRSHASYHLESNMP